MEKQYYKRWMEAEGKLHETKLELEKYKKAYEKNGDFQKQFLKYKKYFKPLCEKYEELFERNSHLESMFEGLVELYSKNVLLNPLLTVKVSKETQKQILDQVGLLLREYVKLEKITKYDILKEEEIDPTVVRPNKRNTSKRNFVVKKNKQPFVSTYRG